MLKEIVFDAFTAVWLNRKRVVLLVLSVCLSVWMLMIIFSLKSAVRGMMYNFLSNKYAVTQNVTCRIDTDNSIINQYGLSKVELDILERNLSKSCKGIAVKSDNELAGTVLTGERQKVTINGVSNEYFECMKMELMDGRFFNEEDYTGNYSGVVISNVVVQNCFGSIDDAIGSKLIFLDERGLPIELHVIGVYRDKNVDISEKNLSLLNYNTVIYCTNIFLDNQEKRHDVKYSTFYVLLNDIREIENIVDYMEEFLQNRFFDDGNYNFKVYGMDMYKDMYDIIDIITFIFAVVIMIVFFVSGISIMNVMLVSVRRRTKEIGIQKALGEKNLWIKLQFILEAIYIGILGEILGVIIGFVSILIISQCWKKYIPLFFTGEDYKFLVEQINFFPSINVVLLCMVYCLCTSIIFGIIPADKAAKLTIVDAIRFKN